MITTMPQKERVAPYVQKDNVAGKMFDGLPHAIKNTPTVCIYLSVGGKYKTYLTKLSELDAIIAGTFDFTELDELVTTSVGTIDDTHYTSASVKGIEGEQEPAVAATAESEYITVPVIYTGAYQAMKVKYVRIKKDLIKTAVVEI